MGKHYPIGQLAELTGVTRRTIRFYVQQGLLPAPEGAGRGHHYTEAHLTRLQEILRWQERGLSLREISDRLQETADPVGAPGGRDPGLEPLVRTLEGGVKPQSWVRLVLAAGCEIHLESGRCRLTPGRVDRLREALRNVFPELFDLPGRQDGPEHEL